MFVTDCENIIVMGTNKVVVKEAITFERNGKIVGALDAYYDFNELDPSLHQMALGLVQRQTVNLLLPR